MEQFRQGAHELGAAAVVIRSADVDDDVQFKQVKELIGSRIDVLVFLPHDTGKAGRFIDAAHARHVPVISYDRLVTNAPADLYIGFDLFLVGVLQPQALVAHVPKGTYLLLGGSPLDANSKVVRAEQMQVLRPLIAVGPSPEPEGSTAVVNGSQTTKTIQFTPIAVTQQNAKDTVLKGGFQNLETLKRALPKEKWAELQE